MEPVLLGLEPPSNVQRILNDAKQDLYATFASISAIALGPIIPLCYRSAPIEAPAARNLPHGIELATGEWTLVEGALMLGVEPADRLLGLARELADESERDARAGGVLPPFPGIYLACPSEAALQRRWPGAPPERGYDAHDMIRRLGAPLRARWSVSELICWRVTVGLPRRWWDDVRCEELWRVRLRKGDARTP